MTAAALPCGYPFRYELTPDQTREYANSLLAAADGLERVVFSTTRGNG